MDTTRIAHAEKIIKVMARAMSPFEGEARTAAAMAKELIEKYGFTKHELKFSNGFDPNFFEKAWQTCEMYWEEGESTFQSKDTDRPDDGFDYDGMPRPINGVTRKQYRGKNIDRLYESARANGFQSHEWAGLKQWNKKKGRIVKGSKSTRIWFFEEEEYMNEQGERAKRRHYFPVRVFNRDQVQFAA